MPNLLEGSGIVFFGLAVVAIMALVAIPGTNIAQTQLYKAENEKSYMCPQGYSFSDANKTCTIVLDAIEVK